MHTVAARSVAEQPRLLHRRLDGGEELYYNQAMVEPLIQCLIQQVPSAHWDFLPKFLSLHYYTTLEGVFGVQ